MDEETILKGIVAAVFQENSDDEDFLKLFMAAQPPAPVMLPLLLPLFEGRENHVPKVGKDEWISRLSDSEFLNLFRMTKTTFSLLLSALDEAPDFLTEWNHGLQPITPTIKTHIGLMYLSSQQPMRKIGEYFSIADSTVTRAITDMCVALVSLRHKFIKWPKVEECPEISEEFQSIANFPGIVGSLGLCQIDGKFLKEVAGAYINPKSKKTTIILQAVCTAKKILTYIHIGPPAGENDVRVENLTSLTSVDNCQRRSQAIFENPDFHLVGDSFYPLKPWLMVPFRNETSFTKAEREFNSSLNRSREVVEDVFKLLKGRWKRLFYIDVNSVEKMRNIIQACCILHNFCLLQDDHLDEMLDDEVGESIFIDPPDDEREDANYSMACLKRNQILSFLL